VILLLQSSVTLNILVVVSIHPTKDEASLTKATVGTPQLSSASITTAISGVGNVVLQPATLIGAGFEAVGGVMSFIVIVCVSTATFPQASVTVHVLVIVAGQAPLIAESDPVTVPPPLQSLVYDKSIIAGTSATQGTDTSPGGATNTGPESPVIVYV
jgi:hypothetical protein